MFTTGFHFVLSSAGVLSEDSVVTSLVEKEDTDVLARMALRLDGRMSSNWRHLALQLNVPNRVLCNIDPHQQYDNNYHSSTMLLKFIPKFDPEFTLDKLKASLSAIGVRDAVPVIENAGIPGMHLFFSLQRRIVL